MAMKSRALHTYIKEKWEKQLKKQMVTLKIRSQITVSF